MPQDELAPLIDLENPENWPSPLKRFLHEYHQLFLGWETDGGAHVSPQEYDAAVRALEGILRCYAIRGWHCTRLTEDEIAAIERNGMSLPSAEMLVRRIDAVAASGVFTPEIAELLKAKNQAHEFNRAGKVWFCFFPPSRADEGGIGDFFRYWGGEALYNSHDRNRDAAPIIGKVGTPCIVEADVPIALLPSAAGLAFKVVRRFLISRGFKTGEPVDHEDRVTQPLPALVIKRVIRFPSPEFAELSGCESWNRRIDG